MPDIRQYLNGYQPQLIEQIEQLITEENATLNHIS